MTQRRYIFRLARKWYQNIASDLLDFARWFLEFAIFWFYLLPRYKSLFKNIYLYKINFLVILNCLLFLFQCDM